jgi:hypothetical protein
MPDHRLSVFGIALKGVCAKLHCTTEGVLITSQPGKEIRAH